MEIKFNDSNQIVGASIRDYLLEKSRVVGPPEGDRNFHIFYFMLAGMPEERKEQLTIDGAAEKYYYLNIVCINKNTFFFILNYCVCFVGGWKRIDLITSHCSHCIP